MYSFTSDFTDVRTQRETSYTNLAYRVTQELQQIKYLLCNQRKVNYIQMCCVGPYARLEMAVLTRVFILIHCLSFILLLDLPDYYSAQT